jgi:hypothetical protein
MERAVAGGHVYCMHHAIANGARPDERTVAMAAEYGRLECLRYLHENGYPWNYTTLKWAIYSDSQECLNYAIENGCPFPPSTDKLGDWPRADHKKVKSIRMLVRVVGMTSTWYGVADWEKLCPRLRAVCGDEAPKVAHMLYAKSRYYDKRHMLRQMAAAGLCDLDMKEWRATLFDRGDLEGELKDLVEAKKEEIEGAKKVAMEVLPVCEDVIKHVLFGYF